MNGEFECQKNELNHEEMLKQLINTAMTTRKTNTANTFLENLPTAIVNNNNNNNNNNVAASLVTLLGQLNNKQLLQQQYQMEKMPLVKRYKCSLCSHVSAWGGIKRKIIEKIRQ